MSAWTYEVWVFVCVLHVHENRNMHEGELKLLAVNLVQSPDSSIFNLEYVVILNTCMIHASMT